MDPMLARIRGARRGRAGRASALCFSAMERGTFSSADLGGGPRAYRALSRMARMGYVERVGGRSPGCRYRATLWGRCKAACHALGVGPLPLCVMAEARAIHLMQDECGAERQYPVCLLRESFAGLYDPKTVRNAAAQLCSAGLAERVREGAIRLRGADCRFGPLLGDLHEWIAGARELVGAAGPGALRPEGR